jgi:radical SAM protein with 4Fe4S-binding SPASM domain
MDNKKMYFSILEIEINHHCNRSCHYCPNAVAERKEKGEMDPALFLTLMEQLKSISYTGSISYQFYNEPLLSANLEWFVETTRSHLPKNELLLYTNGTLLTTAKFRTLLKAGINKFIVTKHANVGAFEFDNAFLELTPEEKKHVEFKQHTDLKMTNRGGIVDAGPKSIPPLLPCYIPQFVTIITLKGNVLPCFEDFHQELSMGNIGEFHIKDIWNSKKYSDFRANLKKGLRHLEGPCKKCNRLEVMPPA